MGYGGTGKQVRDFLHVTDLLDLIDIQIANFEALKGGTYNVGGGKDFSLSLFETTELCREVTGNEISIESVPENRTGDMPIFITDSRKIIEATGWQPKRDGKTSIADIYEWIRRNEDRLSSIF